LRPAAGCGQAAQELVEVAWSSPAALAIAPLQDVLNLGRMNKPGEAAGNWQWRCMPAMLTPAGWRHNLTLASNRAPAAAERSLRRGHMKSELR
jgi:4-alpha-glucanotransferase